MAKRTTKKNIEVIEGPLNENEVNVESVSADITSLQEEIKTEIETEAQNEVNELNAENEKVEQDFQDTVSAITEKLVEETKKKDEFLKQLESDFETKTEDELRDMISREIDRLDEVAKETIQQNKVPMSTYYWNGMRYDI